VTQTALTQLDWHGHALQLLPQRALWDPQQRLLLVADLHLGKAESFQTSGVPLPSDGDLTNLNRLLELAQHHRPTAVVVLGDLIHGPMGLTVALRQKLAALPELLGCPLRLVGGNHERGSWIEGLAAEPAQRAGPLWLSHEPCTAPEPNLLTVCGHVHPVALLGQGADRLRLPCFGLDRRQRHLLLPAFGDLTGGHPCPPALERWGIADGQVLPLP
jgi:DNA ligase-associated metallophosphoesterase